MILRSPYPWFGGKSAVAAEVWRRFGDVPNYVEPFFGSGAVLLARPHWPWPDNRIETITDKDCFVANFWRCLQVDSQALAEWTDWPVNEADLHARHLWLTNNEEFRRRMATDPEYYDLKVAGWWVWGLCQWIGSGWCEHPEWKQLPHLGSAGMGVHRPSQQLPHLGSAGMGVHRPSQQLPHLGDAGRGGDLYDYFALLAERLRRVRVCCGDWSRVCGPTPTVKQGLTGVFLDPPYSAEAGRDNELYAVEDLSVAHVVREWAIEHGSDKRLRIALCGYDGEHDMPDAWECFEWKAKGGYSSQGETDNDNARRERIWFSPHCLRVEKQRSLLA